MAAMKVRGGQFVHAPTPTNQDPRLKRAEGRLITVSDQLVALYSDLAGIRGAEGVRARVSDMETQIQNLRGTLFNIAHGR